MTVLKPMKRWRSLFLLGCLMVLTIGKACSNETYGPYHLIGYNYIDRNIFSFWVNDTWGGNSNAHRHGGGGGMTCCLDIPEKAKTLHIKIEYDLTEEQYEKNLPTEKFETDIPVPNLLNKRNGYIEVHFLPERKIEAKWVEFPTKPHIKNTHN